MAFMAVCIWLVSACQPTEDSGVAPSNTVTQTDATVAAQWIDVFLETENAYSRIPLGGHYRMDCEEGLRMGYSIGRRVNQLNWENNNLS